MRAIIRTIMDTIDVKSGVLNIRKIIAKEDLTNMSISIIEIYGDNIKTQHTLSDVIYYILGGEGIFEIDGEKHEVKAGTCIYIPKGSIYKDSGKMTMLSICTPAYDPDTVKSPQ